MAPQQSVKHSCLARRLQPALTSMLIRSGQSIGMPPKGSPTQKAHSYPWPALLPASKAGAVARRCTRTQLDHAMIRVRLPIRHAAPSWAVRGWRHAACRQYRGWACSCSINAAHAAPTCWTCTYSTGGRWTEAELCSIFTPPFSLVRCRAAQRCTHMLPETAPPAGNP